MTVDLGNLDLDALGDLRSASRKRRAAAAEAVDALARGAATAFTAGARPAIFVAHRFQATRAYKRLGHRTLGNYVTEELGISPRRFRSMVTLGRRLRRLPQVRVAFLERQLSWVKAELIAGVATAESEEAWLRLAEEHPVRQLRVLVKEARAHQARHPNVHEPQVHDPQVHDPQAHDPQTPDERARAQAGDAQEEDGPDWQWKTAPAPSWLPGKAHTVLERCARVAGQQMPDAERWEMIGAEFLSSAGPVLSETGPRPPGRASSVVSAGSGLSARRAHGRERGRKMGAAGAPLDSGEPSDTPDAAADRSVAVLELDGDDAEVERLSSYMKRGLLPELKEQTGMAPWEWPPESEFPGDEDAWSLHELLLGAFRRERRVCWHLGRALRVIRDAGLWKDLGYPDAVTYARDRLGISARTMQRLVRVDRGSDDFAALAEAYRRGELSAVVASLVLRVLRRGVSVEAERAWVEYAGRMTVRALRDAVARAEALLAARDARAARAGHDPHVEMPPPMLPIGPSGPASPRSPASSPEASPEGTGIVAPTFAASGKAPEGNGAPTFATFGKSADDGGTAPTFAGFGKDGNEADTAPTFAGPPAGDPELLGSLRLKPYSRQWARQGTPARLELCLLPENREILDRAVELVRRVRGPDWPYWACLNDLLDHFLSEYASPVYEAFRRDYPIFERDGFRCRAPGCTKRSELQRHHIVARSQGGGDEPENGVTLCDFHHLSVTRGWIRCEGLAPDRLYWELGLKTWARHPCQRGPIARFWGDRRLRDGEVWDPDTVSVVRLDGGWQEAAPAASSHATGGNGKGNGNGNGNGVGLSGIIDRDGTRLGPQFRRVSPRFLEERRRRVREWLEEHAPHTLASVPSAPSFASSVPGGGSR